MAEPLETIRGRRQKLLDEGLSFKICKECNDVMRIGDSPILESGAGGIFRDWIYDLHKETEDPLSEATPPFKWIYKIYEKEKRLDRLVNRLLGTEKSVQQESAVLRAELAVLRVELAGLHTELAAVRRSKTWRIVNAARRVRNSVAHLISLRPNSDKGHADGSCSNA